MKVTQLIVAVFAVTGCTPDQRIEREVNFQCESPFKNISAVYISEMRHIFGPPDYYQKVELVSKDSDTSELILEMDHGYDMQLNWLSGDELVITIPEDANLISSKAASKVHSLADIKIVKAKSDKGYFKKLKVGCV